MLYEQISKRQTTIPVRPHPVPDALRPFLDCDVMEVPVGIRVDLPSLITATNEAFTKFGILLDGQSGEKTLNGLALQYANDSDRFFDSVPMLTFQKQSSGICNYRFDKLNEAGALYQDLFEAFAKRGVTLCRGRLLKTFPGVKAVRHLDYDYRIHIPIVTNPGARAIFDRRIHMEPGKIYLHNGYRAHSFENCGDTARVHFVCVVAGMSLDTGFDIAAGSNYLALAPEHRPRTSHPDDDRSNLPGVRPRSGVSVCHCE